MSDLIDKQVVLDTIHLYFTEEIDKIPTKKTEDGEVYVIHKCQPLFEMNKTICKRIKALPSVTPTHNCVGNALDMRCDDAISRHAVLDLIADYDLSMGQVVKGIHALSSIIPQEPKTGHWVIYNYPGHECVYCSSCKEEYYEDDLYIGGSDFPKYCPNCGCRMVETQEGANE